MLATILLFILIFGTVVLSHEFGHYLVGRLSGIHVVEFSMGMGPRVFHIDTEETVYSIRLFPIGGACMFEGEDDDIRTEGSFLSAGVWQRIATVFAGPFFNFVLAFVLSAVLVVATGTDPARIENVVEGSAAEEAGITSGDTILKIDGERVHLYREISLLSQLITNDTPLSVVYLDKETGEKRTTTLTPRYDETAGRYYFGFRGGGAVLPENPAQLITYSFYEVGYWVRATYKSLLMLIKGQVSPREVSGPVGIASVVGETYQESRQYGLFSVVMTMLNLTVLLSVNLGIMNLLPLPALDGGRLVFLLVETLRGKPIPPDKEGMIHAAGLAAFMVLAALIMYNDILKLLR